MFMSHSPINESGDNLLEIDMVMLPPMNIVRTGMDLYPLLTEILGTDMYLDPKNEK